MSTLSPSSTFPLNKQTMHRWIEKRIIMVWTHPTKTGSERSIEHNAWSWSTDLFTFRQEQASVLLDPGGGAKVDPEYTMMSVHREKRNLILLNKIQKVTLKIISLLNFFICEQSILRLNFFFHLKERFCAWKIYFLLR